MIRIVMVTRLFALIVLGLAIGYYSGRTDPYNEEMRTIAEQGR